MAKEIEDLYLKLNVTPMEDTYISLNDGKYEYDKDLETTNLAFIFNAKVKAEDDRTVAYVNGYICGADVDTVRYMDDFNADAGNGFFALIDAYNKMEYAENEYFLYIHNLYIAPEERNKGLASLLFDKLPEILYNKFNFIIKGASVYPRVSEVKVDGNDEIIVNAVNGELNEEQTAMQEYMEKVVENCGYVKQEIKDHEDYYVKVF